MDWIWIRDFLMDIHSLRTLQTYPPGYIHQNITLGEGSDAVTVTIVEADFDILLDGEDGVRARSLTTR
jgi:hypothetical protein